MKKAIAVMMSVAVTSFGAMIQEGTRELEVNGLLDFASGDGSVFALGVGYGYFVADGLQVGASAGYSDSDSVQTLSLGVGAEYNFATDGEWVPYLGVSLGWTQVDIDALGDDDALVVSGEAGVKYFFVENIAISLAYVFDWATEDIYLDDDEIEDTDSRLELGMRFYF